MLFYVSPSHSGVVLHLTRVLFCVSPSDSGIALHLPRVLFYLTPSHSGAVLRLSISLGCCSTSRHLTRVLFYVSPSHSGVVLRSPLLLQLFPRDVAPHPGISSLAHALVLFRILFLALPVAPPVVQPPLMMATNWKNKQTKEKSQSVKAHEARDVPHCGINARVRTHKHTRTLRSYAHTLTVVAGMQCQMFM